MVEVAYQLILAEDDVDGGAIDRYLRVSVGHALRGVPDAEGQGLAPVGSARVLAIDGHRHVGGSTHLLGRGHASALATNECGHHALRVLHQYAVDIHLTDDAHLVLVLRRVNGPLRPFAAHLHHDAHRLLYAVVALQTDGRVVVAHGRQRVHPEAQRLRPERAHVVAALAIDEREPLRHII